MGFEQPDTPHENVQAFFNKWLDFPACPDTFPSFSEISSTTKSVQPSSEMS